MTAKEYIERIISLQKKKDYGLAYNILQEALSYYPSNRFLQTSEIYLLLKLGRLKEARQKAEARLTLLKDNPFFLRTYVEILSKEKDREELLNLKERLCLAPVRDERLYTYLAGILIRIGEKQRAIELLNSASAYIPEGKELILYLEKLKEGPQDGGINYYRERYKNLPPEKAISEIENILFLPDYKEDISLRLFLAELYKKTGDLKRAIEAYSECLKIKDSLHVRKMLGFVYYKVGDMDKAFLYLKDAFIEDPYDHAVYNTIARIIQNSRNFKEAEALVNETLSRHPEARQVYGLLRRLKKT
ncbi:MAG: tetratricopeptide repeat protein [Thermodesulfovibrionales bacterium]